MWTEIKAENILIYNKSPHFHHFRACGSALWSYSSHFVEKGGLQGKRKYKILGKPPLQKCQRLHNLEECM